MQVTMSSQERSQTVGANAVNGSFDPQNNADTALAHTRNQANPWIKIQLAQTSNVASVFLMSQQDDNYYSREYNTTVRVGDNTNLTSNDVCKSGIMMSGIYACDTPISGIFIGLQKSGTNFYIWIEIRAYEYPPFVMTESMLSSNVMPNATLKDSLGFSMVSNAFQNSEAIGQDTTFTVTGIQAYWEVDIGTIRKLKAVLVFGKMTLNGRYFNSEGKNWYVTFGNYPNPYSNQTIYTAATGEGAKEILVERQGRYLAVIKSQGNSTLSLCYVGAFMYPYDLDCTQSSSNEVIYFIQETTTLTIPACIGPKTATVTAILKSVGTSTPPTGFQSLTKNQDNTYNVIMFSTDLSIVGQSYQFQLEFTESTSGGINQPPLFNVHVKCTKSVDCSASIQSDVTYYMNQTIQRTIPACVIFPIFCASQTLATLTPQGSATPPEGFATLTKNQDDTFKLELMSSNATCVGQAYQFKLEFTDSSVASVNQPNLPTFNVNFKCRPTSINCSASGIASSTYYIMDATTITIDACLITPNNCEANLTGTLTPIGQQTPPAAFTTFIQNPNNTFQIAIFSNNPLLEGRTYQFQFAYSDANVSFVTQPTEPNLTVTVKCTRTVDCSASSQNDVTYFITDTTTFTIPACVLTPSICNNFTTSTLTATGASTPSTGLVLLTKNTDNTFKIAISSTDPSITGLTYNFLLSFSNSFVLSVTQPIIPSFKVYIKCTKSVDCSASSQSDFTYFITDLIALTIPACLLTPSICANTTLGSLTSIGAAQPPAGFTIINKNLDMSFKIALSLSNPFLTGQSYKFRLYFTDSSFNYVTQPATPEFNVLIGNPCWDHNSILVDETSLIIQNKIRGDPIITLLSKPHDKITDTWGNGSSMLCGPILYKIFDNEYNALQLKSNDFLVLQESKSRAGQSEIVLKSDDPKIETKGRDFFIVVYLKDYFDLNYFKKDVVLNKSQAIYINLKVIMTNCKIKELKWPVPSYQFAFIFGNEPQSNSHDSFSLQNTCTYPITFRLYWDKQNIVGNNELINFNFEQLKPNGLPNCVSYSPEDFKIIVNQVDGSEGFYKMYLVASISDQYQLPALQSAVGVNLNVFKQLGKNTAPVLNSPLPSDSIISGESLTLDIPINKAIDNEGDSFVSTVSIDQSASTFITFDDKTNQLKIDGPTALKADAQGSYYYKVEFKDAKDAVSTYKQYIQFYLPPSKPNDLPTFKTPLADTFIPLGQNFNIYLPEVDSKGHSFTREIDFGFAESFASNKETNIIKIDGKHSFAGNFEIKIRLKNDLDQVSETSLKLTFAKGFEGVKNKQESSKTIIQLRKLTAQIKSISASGKVTITFSENIISKDKQALMKVDEALQVTAMAYDLILGYSIPIKFISSCLSLQNSQLELQLIFENPSEISMSKNPDFLFVKFKTERVFTTLLDFISIEPNTIISKEIPAQYKSEEQAKYFENSTSFVKNSGFALFAGLTVGQLAGKEVFKRIWSLFSYMQIIVLVNDYSAISMPAVAKQTIQSLAGVLKLDSLNPKKLAEKYNPKLAAKLSDPKSLISSINPLLLIVIFVIALGPVVVAVSLFASKLKNRLPTRMVKAIESIKAQFTYNILIQSIQTGYLNLWISTNLKISQNIKDYRIFASEKSDRMLSDTTQIQKRTLATDTLLSTALASGLITALALIFHLIRRNPLEYFTLQETKDKVGALYKNFNTSFKHALYYAPFFLVRRLFVAAVFVYIETIALKIELIALSCFYSLFYLIRYNPFIDLLDWKIEIMNEVGLLITNIWCLAFSDLFFDSPEEKIQQGWVFISFLGAIIIVNLFIVFKRTIYVYLKEWKRKHKQKKFPKSVDQVQEQIILNQGQNQVPISVAVDNENPPVQTQVNPIIIQKPEEKITKQKLKKTTKQTPRQKYLDNSKQAKPLSRFNSKAISKQKQKSKPAQQKERYEQLSSNSQMIDQSASMIAGKEQIQLKSPRRKVKNIVEYENQLNILNIKTLVERRNQRYNVIFPQVLEQGLVQFQVRALIKNYDSDWDPEYLYYKAMFLMPKDEIWKDRAMKIEQVRQPRFVDHNNPDEFDFIIEEAKYHWFDYRDAQELSKCYKECIQFKDQSQPVCITTTQLIWLVEAAKQREYEKLKKQRKQLKKKWTRQLQQKKIDEQKLILDHKQRVASLVIEERRIVVKPFVPTEIQTQVENLLFKHLRDEKMSDYDIYETIEYWRYLPRDISFKEKLEIKICKLVAQILVEIAKDQENNDFKLKLEQLEEKWVQLEIDYRANVAQIKLRLGLIF